MSAFAELERIEAKLDGIIKYILIKERQMTSNFDALSAAVAGLSGPADGVVAALATHNANAIDPAALDALTAKVAALTNALASALTDTAVAAPAIAAAAGITAPGAVVVAPAVALVMAAPVAPPATGGGAAIQ